MIDISIIIPIYNAEKYLRKCLDSVINQSKKELEFILINDGSTDSSEEIVNSYKDDRIKYFKNKNQGIGKTRNFGIKKATGKYIMFLDSDDYLTEDACLEAYTKIEKTTSDILVFDFYKDILDSKEKITINSFEPTNIKENPKLLLDINLGPCNKLYKTAFLKDNNLLFIENLKYEDAPFVAIALDKAKKIAKLDKPLNHYVIHSNSETTVRDEKIFDILKIVEIIRNYFNNKDYCKEEVDKLTVRIITNYTIQQRSQKDKRVAMEFIDKAFLYLKKEVPDYKNNRYYENRTFLQKTIEKNKTLSKLYCSLYKLVSK